MNNKKTNTKKASKKNASKEDENRGYATFEIQGTVESVYEGEMYDYARTRVYVDGYYTDYNIAVEKDVGIEEGDTAVFSGTISVFYDRNKGRYNTNYKANTVEEVPF